MVSKDELCRQLVDERTIRSLNALAVGLLLGGDPPEPDDVYQRMTNCLCDAAAAMGFEEYARWGDDSTAGLIYRRRHGNRWEYVHLWTTFDGNGGSLLNEWPYVKLEPAGFDQQVDAAYDEIMHEKEDD